ncbi:MAG: hypothetical protein KF718_08515 [Polyangiaceae bacterium]|nr:hypothetical protein [Polyangiaceae bacterium]
MKPKRMSLPSLRLARFAVVLPLLAGCVVPERHLVEARAATVAEQQGHRQTLAMLAKVSDDLARAQALLQQRERELEAREQQLATSNHAGDVATHEANEAGLLVEQLRGELGRVGDHLRAFADEKERLSQALLAAEARTERLTEAERKMTERGGVLRDLSVALASALSTGALELEVADGRILLLVPKDELGEQIGPVAKTAFNAVAGIVRARPAVTLEIQGEQESDGAQVARVSAELASRGIAGEKIRMSPSAPVGAEGMIVVALSV